MKIIDMSIETLRSSFLSFELTYEAIIKAYLDHIKKTDRSVAAYLYVDVEGALKKARAIDERHKKGESVGPFAGLPIAIKDNIVTTDMPTTCGSKMLENYVSPYGASVVKRIEEADGVILGKLNLDEFAMGSTTENSYYQSTKNPHNLKRVPGGSSGGSAAAVASKQAILTLGSDTGGSIRQPASFCGIVGLKPTYGRISRYGLIAFASSLDQIGPMSRSVSDLAYSITQLFGYDEKDSTSAKVDVEDFTQYLDQDITGMKIALPENYLDGLTGPIKKVLLNAVSILEKQGAQVDRIKLTSVEHALPAYYIISSAEASSNLSRFDGVRYGYRPEGKFSVDELFKTARTQGFGKEAKRRILLGTYALSSGYYDAYYKKAQQLRRMIQKEFEDVFKSYDLVISPTAPTTAYEMGRKTEDPTEMYLGDIFTVPVNIAGLPALSLNCGYDQDGMPIGVQIIGKAFDEKSIIKCAHGLERGLQDAI